MASLRVVFAGLELDNPIVVSAGPLTADLEKVKRLADAGVGAVVTKTGFVEDEYYRWVERRDIFPYKPVYKYQRLDKGTLLALPTLCDVPVSEMAGRVNDMKGLGIPIIASIMGLSPDGYRRSAVAMQEAGADAIELDLCCTIPEFLLQYKYAGQNATQSPRVYARIMQTVKGSVSIPVGAKSTFSPFISPLLIEGLMRAKAKNAAPDFITLTGQLAQNPGIDMATLTSLYPFPVMGWHGELTGLTFSALSMMGTTFGTALPQMAASGGIRRWEDVVAAMALGATTVQVNTVILDKGPAWINKATSALGEFLDGRGMSGAGELIGKALDGCMPVLALGEYMRARDALFGRIYAVVDEGRCDGCGVCSKLCPEGAVTVGEGVVTIARGACRGCNLCVLKCPSGALSLSNHDELRELEERFIARDDGAELREFMAKPRVGLLDKLKLLRDLRSLGFI